MEKVSAQNIAINTTGNPANTSALLDIDASPFNNLGILIPRVDLVFINDAFTIATPATSLLVYNTGIGGLSPAGYYYNSGTPAVPVWVQLLNGGSPGTAWLLTGNAGTVDGTNFIGTTDNVPFNIRVDNQKAGRIDNSDANAFFGYQAGNANINTVGVYNTAIGNTALYSNTSGALNTAIGSNALYSNTIGYFNTSVGRNALYSNVAGSNATAIGANAMYYANNNAIAFTNYNVAVGFEALRGSTTASNNWGNFNTAIGYQSLYSNTMGSNNIAIGHTALYSNTNANQNIAIGNGALYTQSYNPGTDWNSDNVAIGYQALYTNMPTSTNEGNQNTAIGNYALFGNNVGGNNTAVGYLAGYTTVPANANGMGSNNTFIGYNTGFASSTQRTNATAIGYNAKVDASNALILGGTGIDAVNVGIGITSPANKLDILHISSTPDDKAQNIYFTTSAAPGLGDSTSALFVRTNVTSTGNGYGGYFKGVGTSSGNTVGVFGQIDGAGLGGKIGVATMVAGNGDKAGYTAFITGAGTNHYGADYDISGATNNYGLKATVAGSPSYGVFITGSPTYSALFDQGVVTVRDCVAIGYNPYTIPQYKLDVNGYSNFTRAMRFNGLPGTTGYILQSNGAASAPTWIDPASLGLVNYWADDGLGNIYNLNAPNFVGVNITTATTMFDVRATIPKSPAGGSPVIGRFGSNDAVNPLTLDIGITSSGVAANRNTYIQSNEGATVKNLILQPNGGNTGIGTASPSTFLHIEPTAPGATDLFRSRTTGTGRAGYFQIANAASASDALYVTSNGTGAGYTISGYNTGTGRAGNFQITNAASGAIALAALTVGTGIAISGYTSGTSRAGYFEIGNAASTASALYSLTNGTGKSIEASNTNAPAAATTAYGVYSSVITGAAEDD